MRVVIIGGGGGGCSQKVAKAPVFPETSGVSVFVSEAVHHVKENGRALCGLH